MKITQEALTVIFLLVATVNGGTLKGARSLKGRTRRKLIDPSQSECQVENPEWVGDGWCDGYGDSPYNTAV